MLLSVVTVVLGLAVGFIRVVGFFVAAASTWLAVSTLGGNVPVSPLLFSVVVVIFVVSFVNTFEVSFVVGLVVDFEVGSLVVVVVMAVVVDFVGAIGGLLYFVVLGFSVVVGGLFRVRGSLLG